MKHNYKILYIQWHDAAECLKGWTNLEDVPVEDTYIESVGWLIAETKTQYVLYQSLSMPCEHENFPIVDNGIRIPKACVIKKKIIK